MSDMKEKLIKRYYVSLILSLLIYFVVMFILSKTGVFIISENIIVFLIITVLYYLIVKNALAGFTKKKIYEIEPELKPDENTKLEQLKGMMPRTKWYKNTTLIYLLLMLTFVVVYTILK